MKEVAIDLWALFEPMIPREQKRSRGVGRPRADPKAVFEAILWMLQTGVQWRFIPQGYFPAYQTCHRYYQSWVRLGLFKKLVRKVRRLKRREGLSEMHFVDGTFVSAKKGAPVLARQSGAKAPK
jgi:transposase